MGAPKSNEIILQNTKNARRALPLTPKYAKNAPDKPPPSSAPTPRSQKPAPPTVETNEVGQPTPVPIGLAGDR